ncbi:MAG: response regulator [Planctomycetota bacterium]|nr:response regulator [Planctomycetota bacterium]
MNDLQPLLLVIGDLSSGAIDLGTLGSRFEIEAAADRTSALIRCARTPNRPSWILSPGSGSGSLLNSFGDAVALVASDGTTIWMDDRFAGLSPSLREQATGWSSQSPKAQRRSHFHEDDRHWELLRAPSTEGSWLCLVLEVTDERRHQLRIEAITSAGSRLLHIDRSTVASLNVAERLRLLEQRIVQQVREELNFDNFEIRLLDPRSRQLELVISENINPLKLGEVIYAREEGNGISGWVAARGESYNCRDVQADPMYREGLDDAASSLTVPLRMHDEVIGVFNIESNSAGNFDPNDQELAELFGEYVAIAMHMLDLLVVERYTVSEQAARNLLVDLDEPLQEITDVARQLENDQGADNSLVSRLSAAVTSMRSRIEATAAGPQSILDAEQAIHRIERDDAVAGRRILVADDEETIRDAVGRILVQLGGEVTTCENGRAALAEFERPNSPAFDLVLSDIKMPDLTGYEIFQEARTRYEGIPVILMTGFGYDPNHSIVRASQEGMQSVLFKPFRTDQLIEAVTNALTSSD